MYCFIVPSLSSIEELKFTSWLSTSDKTCYNTFVSMTTVLWFIVRLTPGAWVVYLGRETQAGPNRNEVRSTVSQVLVHPDYNNTLFNNDIALLKLQSPVQFNDFIRPVCLASNVSQFHTSTPCWATGWGNLRSNCEFHLYVISITRSASGRQGGIVTTTSTAVKKSLKSVRMDTASSERLLFLPQCPYRHLSRCRRSRFPWWEKTSALAVTGWKQMRTSPTKWFAREKRTEEHARLK